MGELAMDDDDSFNPPASAARAKSAPRRRGRLARWTLRLIIALVGLVLATATLLQIILWTDIPRKLVIQKLQRVLGLRVDAPAMRIGWSGHTTLENVKISLPLAQQSFLEVPRMEVTHTSLPMIMLTQDVEVKEAVFHQPSLLVTQDAAGQWNVAEAVDLITRAAGKNQAQEQTPEKPIALPAVTVDAGELKLIDRTGRTTSIQPLYVSGNPNGPLVWKYDAHVEDRVKLSGQVSPGGVWEHEVAFEIDDIAPWLSAWVHTAPALRASGTWHGRVDGANVDGRITFDQLAIGTFSAQGAAMVQRQANGEVSVSPNALVVNTTNALAPKVSMNSGALVLGSTSASAKDLAITVNGGEAKLNGAYSWGDQSASINAVWRDIALRQSVSSSGSATAKLSMPLPGAPHVEAQIESSSKVPGRTVDTQLSLAGEGRSWRDIDWTVNLSHASWTGTYHAAISDLKATIAQRERKFTLASLPLAGGEMLSGSGEFNLDDLAWRLQLSGAKIPIQGLTPEPVAFRLRASGKGSVTSLDELSAASGQIEIQGNGTYDNTRPKPIFATVLLSHLPPLEGANPDAPLRGRVYGEVSLSGTVSPLDLGIDKGMLYGSNVFIGKRNLGNVNLQLVGHVTQDQARIETTEAQFFGGKWRLHGYWPGDHHSLRMQVDVANLSLAEIGALFQQADVSGQLTGSWTLDIPAPDRLRITASGISDLQDVAIGKFHAQRIHADSRIENGKLILDPIHLQQQDGYADAHVDLPIAHSTVVNVKAHVRNWPATAPSGNASASVSAQTELAVDLTTKSAFGPFKAQLEFAVKDQNAGSLSIESTIDGRIVNVHHLEAHALGGQAEGAGVLPIDQPMKSQAKLTWSGLDAAQLAAFIPNADALAGTVSGSAELAPTDDPRSLGPLKLQANLASSDLRFRTLEIGNADLTSYFNGWRFVLDDSTIHAAGGEIHLWARTTTHDAGVRSSQLQIDFQNLDLDALDRALDSNPKPMPGKLAGSFTLIGSIQDRDTLFGDGSLKITDSNLVNLGAIRALYDLMHIGADGASNTGVGSFDLRLDNNTLALENARYFNRGVQVRARAQVKDIWNLPDSALDGTVIGSLRPLRDIKLPYFADADRIMNALQQNLTSVRVKGTARHYEVVPISLDQADQTMRSVILGEVQKK